MTPSGPVDATAVPRYGGEATFARLPRLDDVPRADVAILGVPFDSGVSYRPGARFGPSHIRESSRLLRPYNPALQVPPFANQQVADAGDLAVNPFSIDEAIAAVERGGRALLERAPFVLTLGGDHTIALPMLRAVSAVHGPVAVVHFDAHLDTWDTYFGAAYTHGTPFRRASEEGLLDRTGCLHVGIRGPLYTEADLTEDAELGFQVVSAPEVEHLGVTGLIERIAARVGDRPVYVSVDIDVLDPAHAPGTGTPEAGGLTSRELLATLRSFARSTWSAPTSWRSRPPTTTPRSPASPPPTSATSSCPPSPRARLHPEDRRSTTPYLSLATTPVCCWGRVGAGHRYRGKAALGQPARHPGCVGVRVRDDVVDVVQPVLGGLVFQPVQDEVADAVAAPGPVDQERDLSVSPFRIQPAVADDVPVVVSNPPPLVGDRGSGSGLVEAHRR